MAWGACAQTATAQLVPGLPISVELRAGVSLPRSDFGEEGPGLGATTGLGVAGALHVRLVSYLGAYLSYDHERFGCGACGGAGFEGRMPAAGFDVGLEAFPVGRLWVGAGALFGRRLQVPDGGDGFASESATGVSLGAGLLLPLGALELRPALRYRSYSVRFAFEELGFGLPGTGDLGQEVGVASVAFEIGLSYEL